MINKRPRGRKTNVTVEAEIANKRKHEGKVIGASSIIQMMPKTIHIPVRSEDAGYCKWKLSNKYMTRKEYDEVKQRVRAKKNGNMKELHQCSTIHDNNTNVNSNLDEHMETNSISLMSESKENNTIYMTEDINNKVIHRIMDLKTNDETEYNEGNTYENFIISEMAQFYSDKFKSEDEKHYCCFCTRKFYGLPAVIPYAIQNIDGKDVFLTHSVFCTFNCALAEVLYNDRTVMRETKISLMYELCREIMNDETDEINFEIFPSPPKEIMRKYGGIYNQQEYEEEIGNNARYMIQTPSVVHVNSKIERLKIYGQYGKNYPNMIRRHQPLRRNKVKL